MTYATPTKLKNGTWGARVTGCTSPGMSITIRTSKGKTWTAVVDRVLWTDGDASIVSTMSTRKAQNKFSELYDAYDAYEVF